MPPQIQKLFHCLNFQRPGPKMVWDFFKPTAGAPTFPPPPHSHTNPLFTNNFFFFLLSLSYKPSGSHMLVPPCSCIFLR